MGTHQFDRDNDKAVGIVKGFLDARSPRISDISNNMDCNADANYKTIQRFILSFPYKGRAIPFNFITYSSKTINDNLSLRNLEHLRLKGELKELLGDKPLIMYREFSYEWMFENMVTEGIKFVIRLKVGNNPTVLNENGDKVGKWGLSIVLCKLPQPPSQVFCQPILKMDRKLCQYLTPIPCLDCPFL